MTPTAAGHELVEQLVDRVLGREAELLSGLAPEQRTALTELLRNFLDDLHVRIDDQGPTRVGA